MAYRANPFLQRMSEQSTSDQEFAQMFSPKLLDLIDEKAFEGAVHIFRSPPGGGKTTLLRALTPLALRAFWNSPHLDEMKDAYQRLVALGALQVDPQNGGVQVLGIHLSCASGYADLPPGASEAQEGLFRALFNCRVVLRALRSLGLLLGHTSAQQFASVQLQYDESARDLNSIPTNLSPVELANWAEQRERIVYGALDSIAGVRTEGLPTDVRFESVLWLQSVKFLHQGKVIAPRRILMIDDTHRLRRKQHALLLQEMIEARPTIPVWIAERTIALGDELLSQGTRDGRDVHYYTLEELWNTPRGQAQFVSFAQNVLDRRLHFQNDIPRGAFAQFLSNSINSDELRSQVLEGGEQVRVQMERYHNNSRYAEWLTIVQGLLSRPSLENLLELYVMRVLILRDHAKRQMSLELAPLSTEELEQRDTSQVKSAAEIFMHEEISIPYYFGIERLCTMATSNIEELLFLAAVLYEALQAKEVLRKQPLRLSPQEQEKLLCESGRERLRFVPKNHTEGTRAKQMLEAIGSFCRERTFLPTAPYAPGVTGVRLSQSELAMLQTNLPVRRDERLALKRVLAECVAENLLLARPSSATTGRESGTIFYLNRSLCAGFGLPLQLGGWQDVSLETLVQWMERGRTPQRKLLATT
jgi:hypothetical protein